MKMSIGKNFETVRSHYRAPEATPKTIHWTDLPFSPLAGLLEFQPLPLSFLLMLGVILVGYIVSTELLKRVFYKRVKLWKLRGWRRYRRTLWRWGTYRSIGSTHTFSQFPCRVLCQREPFLKMRRFSTRLQIGIRWLLLNIPTTTAPEIRFQSVHEWNWSLPVA